MSHRYTLKRILGGPQGDSGRSEEEKNLPTQNLTLHLLALSVDTVPTEPSQLPELCLIGIVKVHPRIDHEGPEGE